MARVKGGYLGGIYDIPKKQPLDSRMLVTKRADLINPSVWKTNGSTTGESGHYNGMIVSVNSDGIYNGIYYLIDRTAVTDENYTAYKNALAIGENVDIYFSMWMKLGTLSELKEYVDEQISNTSLSNIALRRDNDYNYKKIENTFIPENGEVCFVDVAGYGLRTKVGDGTSTFAQLPYIDETVLHTIDSLIVKGYFYQGNFYYDAAHTALLVGMIGRIYIDAVSSKLYIFNGINYETSNGSLPNATAEIAGAVKLYDVKGQNIDGTITQRLFTEEINEKFEMDVIEEEEMIIFDTDID